MGAKKIKKSSYEAFGISGQLLQPNHNFGLLLSPNDSSSDFWGWLNNSQNEFQNLLTEYGSIVLKNFKFSVDDFKKISNTISPTPSFEYVGGTSPRGKYKNVYESSYVPPGCIISQHSEMCYFNKWPHKVYFYCDIPSATGGETPFCSNRLFTKLLDKKILKRFDDSGVLYVRNYLDKPYANTWERSFQTQDKKVVETFCKANGIECLWLADNVLRTKNIAQGCAVHPLTKERLWFNHSYSLNSRTSDPKTISPATQNYLKGLGPEHLELLFSIPDDELPYNTYYGDTGKPIEFSVLNEIDCIFKENQVSFAWAQGDLLLLDNVLATHGRNGFTGDRRILVDLK